MLSMKELHRILFGEAPISCMLEVLIRAVLNVILLQFVVRPPGKRMSGQLTITELSIVIMPGGNAGSPTLQPISNVHVATR